MRFSSEKFKLLCVDPGDLSRSQFSVFCGQLSECHRYFSCLRYLFFGGSHLAMDQTPIGSEAVEPQTVMTDFMLVAVDGRRQ
jgi:hypothetical protein